MLFCCVAGESYDFILTADKPIDNYWFRFHGLLAGLGNYAFGVIRYVGAEEVDPITDPFIDAEGVVSISYLPLMRDIYIFIFYAILNVDLFMHIIKKIVNVQRTVNLF